MILVSYCTWCLMLGQYQEIMTDTIFVGYCLVVFEIDKKCLVLLGIVWYCSILLGIVINCLVLLGFVKVSPVIARYCQVLPCIARYYQVSSGIARHSPTWRIENNDWKLSTMTRFTIWWGDSSNLNTSCLPEMNFASPIVSKNANILGYIKFSSTQHI